MVVGHAVADEEHERDQVPQYEPPRASDFSRQIIDEERWSDCGV